MPFRPRLPGFALPLLALALVAPGGCAELSRLADEAGLGSGPPSERTVAAGLSEALQLGARRAVARTSAPGGFLEDPRLHIPLPEELERPASALRAVGLGGRVDELETTLNRAAERAAGEAVPVFRDAILGLTFEDAMAILRGGETAATELLRRRTEPALRERFAPIVDDAVARVGLARVYDAVATELARLPLVSAPRLDLEDYVTGRALDGLFRALAAEEQRIREDPAARTTELLRRVFGSDTAGWRGPACDPCGS